jgi:hypothetical protein
VAADRVAEGSPHGEAPTVPLDSEGTDEVAEHGEHDSPDPTAPETVR